MKWMLSLSLVLFSKLSFANYTRLYHVDAQNVATKAVAQYASRELGAASVKFLEISQGKHDKVFSDFFFHVKLDSGLDCQVIAKIVQGQAMVWTVSPNHRLKFNCTPE